MSFPNFSVLFLFLAFACFVSSSTLTKNSSVEMSLSEISSYSVPDNTNFLSGNLLDSSCSSLRPVLYEVKLLSKSTREIDRLAAVAGIVDSSRTFLGFDDKKGIYYYNLPHFETDKPIPLSYTNELQQKAKFELSKLLGSESNRFVFANTESDWVKLKSDSEPQLVMQTFRFTRKINGYHIIDNTAYVRISLNGNGKLCGFEISNPELKPISLKRMIKFSATETRLEQFAASKNTVKSSIDEEIEVSEINAEKAIKSYTSKTVGSKRMLFPNISIFCKYHLANGATFDKFEHFPLDASITPNISDDMLEPLSR